MDEWQYISLNLGVLDSGVHRVLMETLVEVIRHLSSVGTSQKYLVVQTELLHSLLVWTRSTEVGQFDTLVHSNRCM